MFHYLSIIYLVAAVITTVIALLHIIKALSNKMLLKNNMIPFWKMEPTKYLIKLDMRLAIILIALSLFFFGTAIAMESSWSNYINNIKTSQIHTGPTDDPDINQ